MVGGHDHERTVVDTGGTELSQEDYPSAAVRVADLEQEALLAWVGSQASVVPARRALHRDVPDVVRVASCPEGRYMPAGRAGGCVEEVERRSRSAVTREVSRQMPRSHAGTVARRTCPRTAPSPPSPRRAAEVPPRSRDGRELGRVRLRQDEVQVDDPDVGGERAGRSRSDRSARSSARGRGSAGTCACPTSITLSW